VNKTCQILAFNRDIKPVDGIINGNAFKVRPFLLDAQTFLLKHMPFTDDPPHRFSQFFSFLIL